LQDKQPVNPAEEDNKMANEINTTKSYCITINYDAASDCGQVAGKHLSGGEPTIMSGKKVVLFRRAFNGKDVALTYENRPDLAELVDQFNQQVLHLVQLRLSCSLGGSQAVDAERQAMLNAMETEATRR
jgi:hypothetical protein